MGRRGRPLHGLVGESAGRSRGLAGSATAAL